MAFKGGSKSFGNSSTGGGYKGGKKGGKPGRKPGARPAAGGKPAKSAGARAEAKGPSASRRPASPAATQKPTGARPALKKAASVPKPAQTVKAPSGKPASKAKVQTIAKARAAPRPKREPRVRPAPEGPARAGFALLLGRPNVGKSTLLNRLVGEHVAIVSPRPQTTRHRILGVANRVGTQLCLVDAPGVHRAKDLFNKTMVEAAMSAISEVDVVLFLAEAGWPDKTELPVNEIDPVGPFHRELLAEVKKSGKPAILVLTKIDLLPKQLLLPVMEAWSKAFEFREIYPLSGLTGENVEGFIDAIRQHLPEGGPLFPADHLTDQAERSLVAEFIREQIFLQTRDEIPYGAAVEIEQFDETDRPQEEDAEPEALAALAADPDALAAASEADAEDGYELGDDEELEEEEGATDEAAEVAELAPEAPRHAPLGRGLVRIEASIILERASHKGIVIGKGGERLKQIGSVSRMHIERLLGCRVWLGLHVRVVPGWTETRASLDDLGYTTR